MYNFLDRLYAVFGLKGSGYLNKAYKRASMVENLDLKYAAMDTTELANQTEYLRTMLQRKRTLNDILPEAFATVREVSKRVTGKKHFPVQILGGIVMHDGKIAEMKTGEGKTLASTLPAYLNALEGNGVHVVTINEYLAKRDAESNGLIYNFLGLTVGCNLSGINESQKIQIYNADITYGTNNEFGFDYLRRQLRYSEDFVKKEYNYAIIDEIDSILIDEGRTPLIISGHSDNSSAQYLTINKFVSKFQSEHIEIDEQAHNIYLTEKGHELAEKLFKKEKKLSMSEDSLYHSQNAELFRILSQALRAHKIYKKDVDYIIHEGKAKIIDEFTGRILEGRRYSDGLHQAIEAKEGIKIQEESQTLAAITFQNYFRLYKKLAGMTGTAKTESHEFREIYGLDVVSIPTNVRVMRVDKEDVVYSTAKQKYHSIIQAICEAYAKGQPVLVGTASVEKSEHVSKLLKKEKIPHNVLNAKFHDVEAEIIAKAGYPYAVTIATNMAGRGTDIMLGGNPDQMTKEETLRYIKEQKIANLTAEQQHELHETIYSKVCEKIKVDREKVLESGGLLVIGTERNEARRIDDQLRGRSGRQGDVGQSIFYLSLEDDLMRIFGSERIQGLLAKLGLKEEEPITHPWVTKSITKAQQRVEQRNFEVRRNLLLYDDISEKQREVIYKKRNAILENPSILEDELTDLAKNWVEKSVTSHTSQPNKDFDLSTIEISLNNLFSLNHEKYNISKITEDSANLSADTLVKYYSNVIDEIFTHAKQKLGANMSEILKHAFLINLDNLWREHLQQLEYLRSGIGLHAYANRNPLNEYREESFKMFTKVLEHLEERFLLHAFLMIQEHDMQHGSQGELQSYNASSDLQSESSDGTVENMGHFEFTEPTGYRGNRSEMLEINRERVNVNEGNNRDNNRDFTEIAKNMPRNALCPCNSGVKVKHCHGRIEA